MDEFHCCAAPPMTPHLGLVSATINTYTHLTLIWAARCLARCNGAREAFQNIK